MRKTYVCTDRYLLWRVSPDFIACAATIATDHLNPFWSGTRRKSPFWCLTWSSVVSWWIVLWLKNLEKIQVQTYDSRQDTIHVWCVHRFWSPSIEENCFATLSCANLASASYGGRTDLMDSIDIISTPAPSTEDPWDGYHAEINCPLCILFRQTPIMALFAHILQKWWAGARNCENINIPNSSCHNCKTSENSLTSPPPPWYAAQPNPTPPLMMFAARREAVDLEYLLGVPVQCIIPSLALLHKWCRVDSPPESCELGFP